jgi:hypothetical protein
MPTTGDTQLFHEIDEMIARAARRRSRLANLRGWGTTPEVAESRIRKDLIRHLRGRENAKR